MWYQEASQFSDVSANCWGMLWQEHLLNLLQGVKVSSNPILISTISRPSLPIHMCQISDSWCDVRFPTSQFYRSKLVSPGLPVFGSFCKPLRNVVTETFAEPSANWEVSSDRILTGRPSGSFINVKLVIHYWCTVSDLSVPPVNMEVTRAPNFQTVLQTSEEFCNNNIPVVFTTSTNNGGLQGGFDFFDLWLCYLQDWLFDFSIWTFLTFQAKILTYSKWHILWNLASLYDFLTTFFGLTPLLHPLIMLSCDLRLFCKQERIIDETSIVCAKNPWQRLKTKLTYFKDCQWLPNWLTFGPFSTRRNFLRGMIFSFVFWRPLSASLSLNKRKCRSARKIPPSGKWPFRLQNMTTSSRYRGFQNFVKIRRSRHIKFWHWNWQAKNCAYVIIAVHVTISVLVNIITSPPLGV